MLDLVAQRLPLQRHRERVQHTPPFAQRALDRPAHRPKTSTFRLAPRLHPSLHAIAQIKTVHAPEAGMIVVGGALNILVIDDEERGQSLLQTSLSHHRISVEVDGRKAIDRIAAEDFDIVLCDLMMPRMTGMESHAELERTRSAAAERMIFMTGGVFVEEAEEFLRSVPGRWIEKPIDFGELESQIWQRMEARTQADPSITAT